jgi:hypothetical protein
LGNGISGHVAGILKFISANCRRDIATEIIEATVASSLFLFWSIYYDKSSTAAHSYIEVFQAISQNLTKNIEQVCFSNNPYETIKRLCLEKKFSALEFLVNFK